jgi:acarbose 7IV-phosphotransferase
MRALVLGGLSFDTIVYLETLPRPVPHTVTATRFHETIGETGAGKALNLRKLGFQVTLHALLGDDPLGDRLAATLDREPINFLREPDPRGTRRHVNLMDASGGRLSISLAQDGPEPRIDQGRIEACLPECDYVVLNIDNYCRELIQPIRAAGKAIWCDIHDYDGSNTYHQDFITAADHLFLSSDLLPDYRAFVERMRRLGKRLVVCTHGAPGQPGSRGMESGSTSPAWPKSQYTTPTGRVTPTSPDISTARRATTTCCAACSSGHWLAGCVSRPPSWPIRTSVRNGSSPPGGGITMSRIAAPGRPEAATAPGEPIGVRVRCTPSGSGAACPSDGWTHRYEADREPSA